MKKQLIGYMLCLFILGCSGLPLKGNAPKKDLIYGSEGNKSGVIIINRTDAVDSLPASLQDEYDMMLLINNHCLGGDEKFIMEEIISFGPQILSVLTAENIVSVGIKTVDWYIGKKEKEIERIKEAAQVDYANRVIFTSFDKVSCAITYRYQDKDKLSFVSLLQFQQHGDKAFTFHPLYIRARDSIAMSKKSDTEQCAKMDVSFALSLKTVREENHFPVLSAIGEGLVTVPNIAVGSDAACSTSCWKEKTCEHSDLIPLPLAKEAVSLTLVTRETGHLGLDLDKSLSQMKALRKAIGPILKNIPTKE